MTTPKALITFAQSEGGFASQVAKRLDRAHVAFERHSVRSEKDDLQRLADRSGDLLVVLLSQESLSSMWSHSALGRAEWFRWQGSARDLVVLAIDSLETLGNLPPWLRAGVVMHTKTPAQAFNVISSHLAVLETGSRIQPLFVGREAEVAQLAAKVAPPIGVPPPSVILVHGLEGVGRRSLVSHVMRNYLSLTPGPVFELRPTDSIDWLHVLLVQEAREIHEQDELASLTRSFHQLSEPAKIRELVALLAEVSVGRRAPIIVDSGSFVDEAGSIRPEAMRLMEAVHNSGQLRLGLVMDRAPRLSGDGAVAVHRLGPLTREATRLLLTQEFREAEITCESSDVSQLAAWAAGYPPAVRLIVSAVQQRGLKSVMADDIALRDLTLRLFVPLLDRLTISPQGWAVLRILAPFSVLPAEVVARMCEQEVSELQPILTELTARNILITTSAGIGISSPLRTAIAQRAGLLDETAFGRIAETLRTRYGRAAGPKELLPIEVVEALTVAVARSEHAGQAVDSFGAYGVPSTLVGLAHESYISRHWGRALQYAERASAADPRREDALVLQLKAHVRLGHWENAEEVLERIEQRGMRSRHYLRGFIHWKRNHWSLAVDSFRAAIDAGDRSTSVRRDLATCLFMLGKLADARHELEQIDERAASSNRYILDLMAHIAIRLGNLEAAQGFIDQLRRHGFRAEYLHRLAHVRIEQGKFQEALVAAEEASKLAPYRRESQWLRAEALAGLGRTSDAEAIIKNLQTVTALDADIKRAMLTLLQLEETHDWRRAAAGWETVRSTNNETVRRLRMATLRYALDDKSISPSERETFEPEYRRLAAEGADMETLPPDFALIPEA